ncbi:MAG: PQQ-binding-like beta-propeller repeat protein [Acidobacteriota bacterium]
MFSSKTSRLPVTLVVVVLGATLFVQLGTAQQNTGKAAKPAPTKAKATPAKYTTNAAAKGKATPIPPGDWPLYSRDYNSTRFSPLTQITPANVASLKQAWSFRPAAPAPVPGAADAPTKGGGKGKGKGGGNAATAVVAESTPIVVAGVMYVPAGNRVVAIDADTGTQIWSYTAPGAVQNRAVGYWPGDATNPPRVLFTVGTNMMAVNAKTGALDPGFGKEGVVPVEIGWGGAPYVYKNLIIMGNNNGETNVGLAGDTRVFDARTGVKLWQFASIAQPGNEHHASWLDDGWKQRGGVNVWGWYFSVDEERDLIFMPFGSPAGNYWGGDRPGSGLYANSLVAVDAKTGKYKWHFQFVHHDLWDTDLPSAPSLFNVKQNGKTIPALAIISKNALMYILNRETGKPIIPVEERPVPQGTVPGEWYSPTQPVPVKPRQLARNSFDKATDFIRVEDTTPEHVKACEDLWEKAGGYENHGPFSPFGFHEAGAPPHSYLQFPGNGGPNWGGTSADPTTGYVYVTTHDAALSGWIEKKIPGGNYGNLTEGSTLPYDRASVTGPGPYSGFTAGGYPCQRPPWGRMFAINANTGDIAWEIVLGVNERLPEGKQKVGSVGSAGPTTTASGLLFVPSADSYFHAFDSKTGKELWSVKMDTSMNANAMTYTGKSGKQYVAGVVGGAVVAWALP